MPKQNKFTDSSLKVIYENFEEEQSEEAFEGEVVDEEGFSTKDNRKYFNPEDELRKRIESGEWDNLDDCRAFKTRTIEGQIMARTEAIDFRIRQLERHLPILLNRELTPSYIQVLKKIRALRMTKTAILALFYKDQGQRDIG
ncbi:MAG: hypothetical protein Q8P91_02860 [bacterium]|nr:hypothetical protein [bacterium]